MSNFLNSAKLNEEVQKMLKACQPDPCMEVERRNNELNSALRLAVALLKDQAQSECYLCYCDDGAKRVLKRMAKALGTSIESLKEI